MAGTLRNYTIGAWRKGSAAGFDPVCPGSIPGVPATLSQGKALSKNCYQLSL